MLGLKALLGLVCEGNAGKVRNRDLDTNNAKPAPALG